MPVLDSLEGTDYWTTLDSRAKWTKQVHLHRKALYDLPANIHTNLSYNSQQQQKQPRTSAGQHQFGTMTIKHWTWRWISRVGGCNNGTRGSSPNLRSRGPMSCVLHATCDVKRQFQLKTHKNTFLRLKIQRYSKTFKDIQRCSEIFKNIQRYSKIFKNIQRY